MLVLLDLSAAFDTIDHKIMLTRLRERFGVTGTALNWFQTYLSDRRQAIHLNGENSEEAKLIFGVPQGSVLGPVLFTAYTAPLGNIARRHGLNLHLYADDTQIYLAFSPQSDENTADAIRRIEACVAEIRAWLTANKLKLNDDKSEALVICSPQMRDKINVQQIEIGNTHIPPASVVRNIGVQMDNTLTAGPKNM